MRTEIEIVKENVEQGEKLYWQGIDGVSQKAYCKSHLLTLERWLDNLLSLGFCCDDNDFDGGCACGRCIRIRNKIREIKKAVKIYNDALGGQDE